ncbi:uncharacterized protein LOC133329496 [Musca vetustissima]|uniref:uncharacterized protein LOC133329496 n=1 Tax=Musca vetustissima TaxID=27455 RepID=UPI002AB605AF|nr:uncharacterized protein LOC133329496 [Musca vetustissima]
MTTHPDSHSGDLELKNLLTSWHLEHHYNHFREQKITLQVLKILKPQHIEKLFANRPLGDQVMFEHRLNIWQQLQLLDDTPKAFRSQVVPIAITENRTKRLKPNESSQELEVHDYDDTEDNLQDMDDNTTNVSRPEMSSSAVRRSSSTTLPKIANVASESSAAPLPSVSTPSDMGPTNFSPYSVRDILNSTFEGKTLISYYQQHKIFLEDHRTTLLNILARHIDANECKLTMSQATSMEKQILEMFPTEREEFYRTGRRGRLYNKIHNMKRIHRRLKQQQQVEESESISKPASPSDGAIKKECIVELNEDHMRFSAHSHEERMEFWNRTQAIRFRDIDEIESLQDILNKWPEYKKSEAKDYVSIGMG